MNTPVSRRRFLQQAVAGSVVVATTPALVRAADSPANRLNVAVMGLGRGFDHVKTLLTIPGVKITHLCEVDSRRLDRAAEAIAKASGTRPKGERDVRKVLDDKSVDAIFIATPNFWHATATIMACAAGKHVYVEKPGSGTAQEGQLMVAAARKHNRVVQMGNQRRSYPGIIEGIEKLRAGAVGRVLSARCWYNNSRQSIGRGKPAPVPDWLDYALWQGPLVERPYKDNLVPYNWHWMWHWGNGELGNNGIHYLDLARWGLGAETPRRVTFGGGRYHFEDDQETPDTGVVTYDFGNCFATWEFSSCHPRAAEKFGLVHFYGEKGTFILEGGGYRVLDGKGAEVEKSAPPSSDKPHFENFLNCIRDGKRPNSDIAEGQKSTLLCHLGNIAYRTGHTVNYDPARQEISNDADAMKLWRREYRPGWEPKV
jgi:predicted dehydrogenase